MAIGTGVKGILYINTGTDSAPTWTLVGGQRNATLSFSKESVDVTNKGDYGWRNTVGTTRGVSIDIDGLVDEADSGYLAFEDVFFSNTVKKYEFRTPNGRTISGTFELSNLDNSYPYDDAVGYSATLESKGQVART